MPDYTLADTVYKRFTTRAFATGIPTVLAGTPVVSAYEDDSITQITAGITLGVDHDSVVGLNLLTIVATAANGYEAGKSYDLVITAGTVDSVSVVGEVVWHFTLEAESASVDLANATDGLTVLKSELDGIQADTEDIQTRLPAALVGGLMSSDVTAISTDTTAADNLELMYDGTGYTDDTGPSSRAQVSGLGTASGGSLNFPATEDNTGATIKGVSFVGVQTGTFANVEAEDGTYHVIDDTANDIDIIYGFDVGGSRLATEFTFKGFLNSNNDNMFIQAYDFVGADWDTRVSLAGKNGTSNDSLIVPLLIKHTGTGADLGKVYIRFEADGSMSNPDLNVDELLVAAISSSATIGYEGGAVWLDTGASNTNTESFVDGTADNPVSTIAAAKTIADNLNIKIIRSLPGTSFTLAATFDAFRFIGSAYTVALGGQSIEGASFDGATISGIGTATVTPPVFTNCTVGTATLPPSTQIDCIYGATMTLGSAGDYFVINGRSGVAGSSAPTINYNSIGASSTMNIRSWSGGLTATNIAATTVSSWEFENGGTAQVNGTGGSVFVRGRPTTTTDNSGGSVTLDITGVVNRTTINAEVDTALNTAIPGGATADSINERIASMDDLTQAAGAGDLAAILVDTAEIGAAGAGLTAINLPNQTMDIVGNITGNITGNLSGSVGSVTGAVGSLTANNDKTGYTLTSGEKDATADHVLRRTIANARASADGDAVAFRSLLGAISKLVNRIDTTTTPGRLTIMEEDDATTFGEQALTTDATADPVTVADTV